MKRTLDGFLFGFGFTWGIGAVWLIGRISLKLLPTNILEFIT